MNIRRYDLLQVNSAYTTDHEMERSDDGEWVRFEDVEAALAAEMESMSETCRNCGCHLLNVPPGRGAEEE
jgi:hypothetical protein